VSAMPEEIPTPADIKRIESANVGTTTRTLRALAIIIADVDAEGGVLLAEFAERFAVHEETTL